PSDGVHAQDVGMAETDQSTRVVFKSIQRRLVKSLGEDPERDRAAAGILDSAINGSQRTFAQEPLDPEGAPGGSDRKITHKAARRCMESIASAPPRPRILHHRLIRVVQPDGRIGRTIPMDAEP